MTVPGITRLDSDRYRVHGYRVRLNWKRGKPTVQGWFPDLRHGGKTKALAAATKWAAARRARKGGT